MTALLVAFGSALGGVSRYGVSLYVLGSVAAGLAAVWIGYCISK